MERLFVLLRTPVLIAVVALATATCVGDGGHTVVPQDTPHAGETIDVWMPFDFRPHRSAAGSRQ